jgi:protocatechuate 3,4-dioxygenase beta subunit
MARCSAFNGAPYICDIFVVYWGMMNRATKNAINRREALGLLSAAGFAFAAGCGSSPTGATSTTSSGTTSNGTTGGSGAATCAVTPEETAGPYPDRTGMLNNLAFYRQDITEGRSGLPLTLIITVVNATNGCAPVTNASVEVWQCDAAGTYSEYGAGAGQTFLRGLQTTDTNGVVRFRTIYPGWYQGRATHIHLEVFVNGAVVKTTQIAFPEDVSAAVYGTGVYASHGQNLTTNSRDNVFSDGTAYELATLSGSTTSGYTATLTVGVSV